LVSWSNLEIKLKKRKKVVLVLSRLVSSGNVEKYSSDGTFMYFTEIKCCPTDILADSGRIVVAYDGLVTVHDGEGNFLQGIGSINNVFGVNYGLGGYSFLARDSSSNIYILYSDANAIFKLTPL
jgi:hypothetical protein